jgi:hypothetical protein
MEKKPETIREAAAEVLASAGFKGMAREVLSEGGDIIKALNQAAKISKGLGCMAKADRLKRAAHLIENLPAAASSKPARGYTMTPEPIHSDADPGL